MKNIKYMYMTLIAIVMFAFSSCESYFGDTNLDPNNPTEVPASVLLPSIEGRLAYLIGGDLVIKML